MPRRDRGFDILESFLAELASQSNCNNSPRCKRSSACHSLPVGAYTESGTQSSSVVNVQHGYEGNAFFLIYVARSVEHAAGHQPAQSCVPNTVTGRSSAVTPSKLLPPGLIFFNKNRQRRARDVMDKWLHVNQDMSYYTCMMTFDRSGGMTGLAPKLNEWLRKMNFHDDTTRFFWSSPYVASLPGGIFAISPVGSVTHITGTDQKPCADAELLFWTGLSHVD